MLLNALPQSLKTEFRELSCVCIIYKVLRAYLPGGQAEKGQILQALTVVKKGKTVVEAIDSLRGWQRYYKRAQELKLTVPDPLLQVAALNDMVKQVVQLDMQVQFRVGTFRMQHQVDVAPTQSVVENFYTMLLAELEHLHHTAKPGQAGAGDAKLKKMNGEGGKGDGKQGGKGACQWWGSDGGCKKGRFCSYTHDWQALYKTRINGALRAVERDTQSGSAQQARGKKKAMGRENLMAKVRKENKRREEKENRRGSQKPPRRVKRKVQPSFQRHLQLQR